MPYVDYSLGNVALGYKTTLPVTLTGMIRHARAVQRGSAGGLRFALGTVADLDTAL